MIFNFFFSLSYKFKIKLNTFFEYKFEADTGNLFKIFASPKILTPFFSTILFTSVNTVFTEVDKIIEKNGVKILGEANILNKLPVSASNLYAKNVFNFISNLYDKDNKKLNINLEDEIIEKTLIK